MSMSKLIEIAHKAVQMQRQKIKEGEGPQPPEGHCQALTVSAAGPDVNPLGLLQPSVVALTLQTGFEEFRSPEPLVIGGLCQIGKGKVDILAVMSAEPGKGHFTRFIEALERSGDTIVFWAIMSDDMAEILHRRHYLPVLLKDKFGESHRCMTNRITGALVVSEEGR